MTNVEAFIRVQEASYVGADGALRGSWPRESAMDENELKSFLDERTYCVLATTTPKGRPQARPVAFTVSDGAFWFATVKGGRLRNVQRTPWASVVIAEGEGPSHRAVAADGPVRIAQPSEELLAAWETRIGSRADWASAWFELQPARLFSYAARRAAP